MPENTPVALAHCADYSLPTLKNVLWNVLENAYLPIKYGMKVLVKPNLLLARELACTNPQIVAALCSWLLDHGVKAEVGDSPAFGSMRHVANMTGLTDALKPLSVPLVSFGDTKRTVLPVPGEKKPVLNIAVKALECDLLISTAKVKAHSQVRITLCVKNCFGCVAGLRKALAHWQYGEDRNYFGECLASILKILPPVAAVADGITAMHVTGPSKGKPYEMSLLGASPDAVYMDMAILKILDNPEAVVNRAAEGFSGAVYENIKFTMQRPEDFNAQGFILPQNLKDTSFSPWQLTRSLTKRIWKVCRNPF